jgi:hypothetical protein
MRHKLILGAAALLLPVGAIASIGAGSATAGANALGMGTFSCKTLTGALTFKPPLTLTAQNVTVSSKTVASNCSGTAKPMPKSATATSSVLVKGESCTSLSKKGGSLFKTNIAYNPVVTPSVENGTLTGSGGPTTPLGFSTKGVVTGSYASKTATSKGNIKQTYAQVVAACQSKAGLPQLTIASGSTTNG